jgi:cytochrome c oxidase cbb3-type subunit 3
MTVPLREHSFDGIQEFDNRLPNWWLWSFYLACIFSVFYWLGFHTLPIGKLPAAAWLVEEQEGKIRVDAELAKHPVTEETLLKLSKEPATVMAGRQLFVGKCAQCHKEDASGNVGPNLTDSYWLHGGQPMQILTTVSQGWPDKGMQAWEPQLGRARVLDVVAFVLSIKNSNRPGKDPQGELEKSVAR